MAQSARRAVAQPTNPPVAPSSNGVLTANNPAGPPGVNRKKQKRRQKQAAKAAAEQEDALRHSSGTSPHASNGDMPAPAEDPSAAQEQYDDEQYYSDDDGQGYPPYDSTAVNGHPAGGQAATDGSRKSRKKKKKNKSGGRDALLDQSSSTYPPSTALTTAMSSSLSHNVKHLYDRDRIWNTSTQEERERIKEFWLDLGEEERKSLVKIEKEAVLRKMKEQQKHSCSCTVCGRKRNAIEEELEVLYDAYYDELEQFGSLQHGAVYAAARELHSKSLAIDRPQEPLQGHIEELPDEDEDDEEDDDDEAYSDEDLYDDYSDDEANRGQADFFNFGNSLTVKGGILTVADDLLKNDGKKFIEMMEQLAERRMAREEEAQYAAASHPSSYHGSYPHNHPPEEDEYDDEEDEDYDSQEEYDEEEEEDIDVMTEEQRMEEGRRMFQIFAARMFEQRVLTAYREKVARERQQKLLEELEEEKSHDVQREAKKARDAQKKKEKKALQKQKQAEEKARKEAEKAAEEAAAKAELDKQQEEQRKKKEEQRKKKEADRKAQEEEKQRKEAEKLKRQQEERDRQQEAERKAREKRNAKEEAQRKAKEEREAKEREARERKAQVEKEKKEREDKAKADKEVQDRARKEAAQAAHQAAQVPKRTGAPAAVPIPPGLSKQPSNVSSPHVPVATPALPKAPTPVRARQGSQQGSKGSSPKTPSVSASQAKSVSPATTAANQPPIAPKTILQKPQPPTQPLSSLLPPPPSSPIHSMPPPGIPASQTQGFGVPPGLNGLPVNQGPMVAGTMQRGPSAQSSHGFQPPTYRPFGATTTSYGPAPPGIPGPNVPYGRGFPDAPPGLPHQFSGLGNVGQAGPFSQMMRDSIPATSGPGVHSRQTSFEQKAFEAPTLPIARPVGPPKRESSVKPIDPMQDDKGIDVDDITRHLGSSALLDDSEEALPLSAAETQRPGAAPGLTRGSSTLSNISSMSAFGASPIFSNPTGQPTRTDAFGNPIPNWSTPPLSFGGTPAGLPGAASWGTSPTSGWTSATSSQLGGFGLNMGLGSIGSGGSGHRRPVQIRINICNACRQLMAAKATNEQGFVDAGTILRHVENSVNPPVSLDELLDFCETEGNASNGGGSFQVVKRRDGLMQSLIKFEADPVSAAAGARSASGAGAAGDIGSPSVGAVSGSAGSQGVGAAGGPFGSLRGFPFGTLSGQ